MGSRRTQERRRAWLLAHGVTEEALATVHAPIGLDIGANAPGEIAVAILAEVIAVRAGRTAAGSVGDREGPIHPDLPRARPTARAAEPCRPVGRHGRLCPVTATAQPRAPSRPSC